jgi:hypothetical protein
MNGSLLANLIWIFHFIVVLFVVIAPFSNVPIILLLHATFSISLLVHWYTNNNICSLSLMESQLRGLDYTESFTHKLISPIYDISKTEWSNLSYIITLVLFTISAAKIYNDPRWKMAWESLVQTHETMKNNTNIGVFHKLIVYIKSLDILMK